MKVETELAERNTTEPLAKDRRTWACFRTKEIPGQKRGSIGAFVVGLTGFQPATPWRFGPYFGPCRMSLKTRGFPCVYREPGRFTASDCTPRNPVVRG
jgi:hypothetical protein